MHNNLILKRRIKTLIVFFIVAHIFSGLTAFPIEWQLSLGQKWFQTSQWDNMFTRWIVHVHKGVQDTNVNYPFMAYGTDWLAFAHLMIALLFLGPLRDPVKNIWIIEFGIIACISVFPLAFIAGEVRGIPMYWRLLDCMFGVFGRMHSLYLSSIHQNFGTTTENK